MKRRKFLSVAFGTFTLAALPVNSSAENFRKSKPALWKAKSVDNAIKALYGSNKLTMEGVKLITPDVANDGNSIQVVFSTDKDVKSIALFQDANPEAAVMVIDVNKYSLNEKYYTKIKMAQSGTITVVAQGNNGTLYAAKKTLEVALSGCAG